MTPYYDHDGITIYHGDCREVLPTLTFDVVVTDPPYGMTENSGRRIHAYKDHRKSKGRIGGNGKTTANDYLDTQLDNGHFSDELWRTLQRSSVQIVWGLNHLYAVLGHSPRVLVWDKKCANGWEDDFSDCELAWCSIIGVDRMFRHRWMGMLKDSDERRQHPTQKPIALMSWCIQQTASEGIILDPFMGSGTTLRAAKDLGRKAIGIEIEERYCEIAAKRMEQGVFAFSDNT